MDTEESRRRKAAFEKRRRRKKKRRQQILLRGLLCLVIFAVILAAAIKIPSFFKNKGSMESRESMAKTPTKIVLNAPDYDVQLLTPNPYSRPQTALKKVKGIVIHYTANPGTGAQQNHNYFEGLKDAKTTKASSHFIVGLEGEIIQCIPSTEIAYASNDRNEDTLSIECCHSDETGEFSKKTYDTLVHLTAWLCGKFDLTTDDVIRHYDVTEKKCPLYFVEHEKAWEQFKEDVMDYIDKNGVEKDKEKV